MATKEGRPGIYAIDFDGTLCEIAKFPDIGEEREKVLKFVRDRKAAGDKLILWTMREGEPLKAALQWCAERGITFDAVNDNLPELQMLFGNNPRKVFANWYLDDHNMTPF